MSMSVEPALRHAKLRAAQCWSRLRTTGRPRGVVLAYHRIAHPGTDPWNLAVSPENFAAHMAYLASTGCASTLDGFMGELRDHDRPARRIVVTFDDGYACNFHRALPVLNETGVPATLFTVSGAIGRPGAFWWDLLDRIFLEMPELPAVLHLKAENRSGFWSLGNDAAPGPQAMKANATWKPDLTAPSTPRQRICLSVWEFISGLNGTAQPDVVADLAAWAGLHPDTRSDDLSRPMTMDEFRKMSAAPGIEIGGHTATHCDLSRIQGEAAFEEIARDRQLLTEMTGRSPKRFAYPYGRMSPGAGHLLREAGYEAACCSRYGVASSDSDRFLVPRVQVIDCPVEAFAQDLQFLLGRLNGQVPQDQDARAPHLLR